MEKRTKHLTAKLFCLLLLSVVLSACQKEYEPVEVIEPMLPEIAAAKEWYEKEIGGSYLHWRVEDRSDELKADWRNAIIGNNDYFRIIEVPLEGRRQFRHMSSEIFERVKHR